METIRYELKYCERCGTLKLRQVTSVSTYCHPCEGLLARFTLPASPGRRMLARIPLAVVNDQLPGRAQ